MLIIVEGPDGAGKTTLCDKLESAIRRNSTTCYDTVTRLSAGPPTQHPLEEYETPLFYYRPVSDRHVICDRWHLGEWVYPPVLKRDSQFTRAVARHVSMFLRARGAITVLLLPPVHDMKRAVAERGDNLISVDMLEELTWRYRELPFELHADHHVGSWPTYHVDEIIRLAHVAEYNAARLRKYVTYVGPPRPLLLLFGDVRGKGQFAKKPTPAFMPFPSTSGEYLLSYMYDHEMGIANACDVDDPLLLWHDLGSPKVVALGQNAHQALIMPHGIVTHPQFTRRFHHSQGAHYATLIQEASNGKDCTTWH